MKDDIRKKTCLVIRRNNEYLVGKILFSKELRWLSSPYDAWKTRDVEEARDVAKKTGGTIMLFNPIVGQLRVF